jgi:arylsulfatase A-like enzyme
VIPPRTVSSQPVIVMDLHATILAAAGLAAPAGLPLDGEDVLPVLAGKKPGRTRTFFWRLHLPGETFGQKAVRRGKWKYIEDRGMELLFDLDADQGERRNLAYRQPKTVAELRTALAEWEAGLSKASRGR